MGIWGIWESVGPGKPYTSTTQEGLSQATRARAAPEPATKRDPVAKGREKQKVEARGRDGQRDAGQTDRCTLFHKLGFWAKELGGCSCWGAEPLQMPGPRS